jgi:Carbohydrate family 9 binding domain-like
MTKARVLKGIIVFICSFFIWAGCKNEKTNNITEGTGRTTFDAVYGSPTLDGSASDEAWENAAWYTFDQYWIGAKPDSTDFKGRYKVLWDENNLYILAEITDDTLMDTHADGLLNYWDDDCLEIFVDEDASGGNHQYNHSAFAYHISLDSRVVDIAADSSFRYYNDHCVSRMTTAGNVSVWEVAVKIYDGNKYEEGNENIPKTLSADKTMGFAIAYCDNDHSPERENFIGSVPVEGEDKNRGFIDAGIFGKLTLK